ncbi:MAG: HD domain-containing protein [Spirochaetaceae bacterium]|jgi:HD superfamily phosphohydrolase|nr:HD domain-containing protein [Spirochaetaceae bacterium]
MDTKKVENAEAALNAGFTEPVRDALWGHVYFTPELKALTHSNAFMRIHRVAQLGPAGLLYPGATHSRASHSIGVYHITRRLLDILVRRGADEYLSFNGIRSMLCAALLHDLGHFPFAHSLKELPLKDHEKLSAEAVLEEPVRSLIEKTGGDPNITAAIIDNSIDSCGNKELVFYRKLLSGCLDPDKLDYLNRDARYCGVPYGVQDVDFIISMLYPHPEHGVEIDSKGIPSIESVLFSKYLMYRAVYWHSTVRSADAMIKKALYTGLSEGVFDPEELYQLDDGGLFILMRLYAFDNPVFELGEMARQGQLYAKAAEFQFDESEHADLCDIKNRSLFEQELAEKLSFKLKTKITKEKIIIDLPDPVNFETGLFVRDENCLFTESSGFFNKHIVSEFSKKLRLVRIFVDFDLKKSVESLLRGKKWMFKT